MLNDSMNGSKVRVVDDSNIRSNTNTSPALTEEDDWGIVDESDGILILPGDDEAVLASTLVSNIELQSNAEASKSNTGLSEADLVPSTKLDDSRLIGERSYCHEFETISSKCSSDEHNDDNDEETNLPSFDPSIPTEIPSDLESLPDRLETTSVSLFARSKPTEHVTMRFTSKDSSSKLSSIQGIEDGTFDEKSSQAGLSCLRQELSLAEELFLKPSSKHSSKTVSWNTLAFVYAAVGVASVFVLGTSLFVYERRAWQASNNRLEERIEKLQLELMAKMETEKEQDAQRMMEFASLKQEFQQALTDRERQAQEQYEAAVAAATTAATAAAISAAATRSAEQDVPQAENFDEGRNFCSNDDDEDLTAFANSNYHKFRKLVFDMPSSYKTEDNSYHFENCWLQAEAKLGECAQEARHVFRSKLQTLGRSLWNAQESLVVTVNDFGKRVQTAAKEAAEHVLSEQEQGHQQSWSFDKNKSFWSSGVPSNTTKQNSGSTFRTIATTLVSSVAFASLAAVVADKATSFIAGLGTEDQD